MYDYTEYIVFEQINLFSYILFSYILTYFIKNWYYSLITINFKLIMHPANNNRPPRQNVRPPIPSLGSGATRSSGSSAPSSTHNPPNNAHSRGSQPPSLSRTTPPPQTYTTSTYERGGSSSSSAPSNKNSGKLTRHNSSTSFSGLDLLASAAVNSTDNQPTPRQSKPNKSTKNFPCTKCSKAFDKRIKLANHMLQIHRPHRCHYCNFEGSADAVTAHEKSEHSSVECDKCQKEIKITNTYSLRNHYKNCKGVQTRAYKRK